MAVSPSLPGIVPGIVGIGSRNELFLLGIGNQEVDAESGNDTVLTGSGNDFVVGGLGTDLIQTKAGDDFIYGDLLNLNILDGNDVILAGSGSDTAYGGGGNDFLAGDDDVSTGTSNDLLFGGTGNDTIWGQDGADIIVGGDGDDLLFGSAPATAVSQSFSQPYDYDGVLGIIFTGSTTLSLTATDDDNAADSIDGGAGNDQVVGNGGNDLLSGGDGDDQIYGGQGGDYIEGAAGLDLARYDGSAQGVIVRLDYGVGLGGEAQGDTLVGMEGLVGSAQQDFLFGDAGGNVLFGGAGDDWLFGIGGADELHGGTGTDQLIGGVGSDALYGEGGNDQFWILASEFQPNVFDYIYDFGESSDNFDYLRFEGVAPGTLTFTDGVGYTAITSANGGGVCVFGMTTASLQDQIIYA